MAETELPLDLDRHAVIEASAGTGKTYSIERLVLRLLRENRARLDQILLVTYTEKATGELKTRLRQSLELAVRKEPDYRATMQAALDAFDQANISTIHGFCQRVLQEHAFDNRQDFQAELVHDADLLPGCLRELQRTTWRREYGPRLSLMLELAGYARPTGAQAWERQARQLALDFRPACGHELRPAFRDDWLSALETLEADILRGLPRLRRMAGEPLQLESIERHSWYVGFGDLPLRPDWREPRRRQVLLPLLRWLADPASVERPVGAFRRLLQICTASQNFERDGFTLLTETLSSHARAEVGGYCPNLPEAVEILDGLRQANEQLALGEQLLVRTVHQLQAALAEQKRQRGQQSFEDLLTRVDDALDPAKNRRAKMVVAALRQRYRFAVVDEFQDTDAIQWRIFQRIFVEQGAAQRLFVVGDPKQAIFGFRGADLAAYQGAVRTLVKQHNAQETPLTVNWRTCPDLLDALNGLFDGGDWFRDSGIRYPRVQAPPLEHQRNRILEDRTERAALTLVEMPPKLWFVPMKRVMSDFIVAEIQRLLTPKADGAALEFTRSGRQQALAAGDICILVYKRVEAAPVMEALAAAGIPFTFYKQAGLWHSAEATHLEYLLRALARPDEAGAFRKALLTRFYRLDAADVAASTELPAGHAVRELFERWRERAEERRWSELFQSLLEDTGVLIHDAARPGADRALANFRLICQTLEQEAYGRGLDLFGLLDVIDERRNLGRNDELDLQPIETDRPKVRILTVHAAKGLEFPIVFLAGGITAGQRTNCTTYREGPDERVIFDLAPDETAQQQAYQERLSEDQRLLYVALTRAMFKLYVPMMPADCATRSHAGPVATVLAPALDRSHVEGLGMPYVEVAMPQHAALAGMAPLTVLVTPDAPADALPPIELGDDLFPTLDPDLAQRRILVRSFSSLHRGMLLAAENAVAVEQPLRLDDDQPDVLEQQAEWRGPVFGAMVHAVLEKVDYAEVSRAPDATALLTLNTSCRTLIDEQLNLHLAELPARHGAESANECRAAIAGMVFAALRTPLAALGGALADVPAADRLHELAFDFPEELKAPAAGKQEAFLTGVMDLVVRRGAQLFLVDWKTNDLGGKYTADDVRVSMEDCDYQRQYRIYLQALERWLRHTRGACDPLRDFGGVYYLYLRGLNGRDETTGVFFARPTADDFKLERVLGE